MGAPDEPAPATLDAASKKRRASAWIDALSTLLLTGTVAILVVTFAPALLRAAGLGGPVQSRPGVGRSAVDRAHSVPVHPFPSQGDEDEDVIDSAEALPTRIGLSRAPLTLHERASESARITGRIAESEPVMVLREDGDWVLVVDHQSMAMGWTRKSGIAVR